MNLTDQLLLLQLAFLSSIPAFLLPPATIILVGAMTCAIFFLAKKTFEKLHHRKFNGQAEVESLISTCRLKSEYRKNKEEAVQGLIIEEAWIGSYDQEE